MASDKGSVATEEPLLTSPGHHPLAVAAAAAAAVSSDNAGSDSLAHDPSRPRSLKRPREASPTSPLSADGGEPPGTLGSPTKSARFALVNRRSPAPLTGAAALEDQRRQREDEERSNVPGLSENPSQRVLSALAGDAAIAMSRPGDAPPQPITAPIDAPAKPQPAVSKPPPSNGAVPIPTTTPINTNTSNHNHNASTDTAETSPQSATSGATIERALVTASPTPMDVDPNTHEQPAAAASSAAAAPPSAPGQQQQDDKPAGPSSLSYPGSLLAGSSEPSQAAHRTMSFPMPTPGQDASAQHSNGKKHKCPYCETEFTRHHNLKSHLLTHSQEKPFICQQCDSRFRRLHDLKRHSKLHTGEKPHVCPKCHRKFARGDALARHSKGPGGCAGRRSSMGSFADGDMDGSSLHEGDDSMTGVSYANDESMADDERRHVSLPSIKASHVSGGQNASEGIASQHRTYPPLGSLERPPGGLYPPALSQDRGAAAPGTSQSVSHSGAAGHTSTTGGSSGPAGGAGPPMYTQGGGAITESPRPLSPAMTAHDANAVGRQRSPSLTQQFQQQHYGRRPSERRTPPAFAGSTTAGGAAAHHARNSSGSHPEAAGSASASELAMWSYFQKLEDKVNELTNTVTAIQKADSAKQAQIGLLTTDLTSLKKLLQAQDAQAASKDVRVEELTSEVESLRNQLSNQSTALRASVNQN